MKKISILLLAVVMVQVGASSINGNSRAYTNTCELEVVSNEVGVRYCSNQEDNFKKNLSEAFKSDIYRKDKNSDFINASNFNVLVTEKFNNTYYSLVYVEITDDNMDMNIEFNGHYITKHINGNQEKVRFISILDILPSPATSIDIKYIDGNYLLFGHLDSERFDFLTESIVETEITDIVIKDNDKIVDEFSVSVNDYFIKNLGSEIELPEFEAKDMNGNVVEDRNIYVTYIDNV